MKYIILVGDGMADYPIEGLNNKTPLEAAKTSNMDFIARCGLLGQVKTIPDKMAPASDVANMSILGYDPEVYYTGRGPLEAANLGIELGDNDIAFRCNFITTNKGTLSDYSAGHITTKEAGILIDFLNQKLSVLRIDPEGFMPDMRQIKFYSGISYRNLMIIRGAPQELLALRCFPPHDIIGKKFSRYLPKGKGREFLINLMKELSKLLASHEINQVRIDLRENPADMIWLWGQGNAPKLPTYKEKYNLTGSVISAVDLIKGMGKIIGLEVINVPGATGFYDTDYEGKARAAIRSLENNDFVFLHVEAPDEAGHNGDLREKITAIERFDRFVVGKILSVFKRKKNFRILVLPDHPTPLSIRTHTAEPVPFGMFGNDVFGGGFLGYSEKEAKKSKLIFDKGHELINYLIKGK
ncbi:MAG: cofactor-independent phosphoglycerate mutase [Candidatus Omnitrophota bacterium]